jgi:hypothetical protein
MPLVIHGPAPLLLRGASNIHPRQRWPGHQIWSIHSMAAVMSSPANAALKQRLVCRLHAHHPSFRTAFHGYQKTAAVLPPRALRTTMKQPQRSSYPYRRLSTGPKPNNEAFTEFFGKHCVSRHSPWVYSWHMPIAYSRKLITV